MGKEEDPILDEKLGAAASNKETATFLWSSCKNIAQFILMIATAYIASYLVFLLFHLAFHLFEYLF